MAHAHDLSQSSEITLPIELLATSEAANTEMASQVLEKTTVAAWNNNLLWVFFIFPNASLWALQGFTCREIGGESLIYVVCHSSMWCVCFVMILPHAYDTRDACVLTC